MKKSAIALAMLAAVLFAVSCQKETTPEQNVSGPMTISAVTEGIGVGVKADLAYKYDVIWRTGDKICVKNSEKSVEFTLSGGEGTTKGTFSSGESISGEVEGFYPASVANLVWPAEQQNNQVPPMYCEKNLTSTQNQTFSFASLGSVLQLNFNSTTADIVLKTIEVKADQAMSGAFTIDNGQAKINQPEGDKPGITLDLGDEGVKLGTSAKKFNIAIPAGEYTNLTITFTTKDGQKCTKTAKSAQTIEYNAVNTLALSGEFKAVIPDGALPGVFSVSLTKKVHFSKGNLWVDGSKALHFESNQYSFASSWDASHVSHFTWSSTVAVAVSNSNSGDNLFCDESHKVSVDGSEAIYYALSKDEWTFLFNKHTKKWASVGGVTGYVIAPDGFIGDLVNSYANDAALAADNLVFLPAAGYRNDSNVVGNVGTQGFYWSSTAHNTRLHAYTVRFDNVAVNSDFSGHCSYGYSVRLITECQ